MNPMTPPDSVGKVVAEMLEVDEAVPLDLKHWATRLQALDRQRQEAALRDARMLEDAHNGIGELQAALAEAGELLHETGRFLDPRHYAGQIGKLTAFLDKAALNGGQNDG